MFGQCAFYMRLFVSWVATAIDNDDDLDMIIQQCSRSAFSKKDETPSQQPNNVYKTKENKFLNKCSRG